MPTEPAIVEAMQAIGYCVHCGLELYPDGPVWYYPNGQLAHVACHIDQRRRER